MCRRWAIGHWDNFEEFSVCLLCIHAALPLNRRMQGPASPTTCCEESPHERRRDSNYSAIECHRRLPFTALLSVPSVAAGVWCRYGTRRYSWCSGFRKTQKKIAAATPSAVRSANIRGQVWMGSPCERRRRSCPPGSMRYPWWSAFESAAQITSSFSVKSRRRFQYSSRDRS